MCNVTHVDGYIAGGGSESALDPDKFGMLQVIILAYPYNRYWFLGSSATGKLCNVVDLWLK